jgi:hypothetical protein
MIWFKSSFRGIMFNDVLDVNGLKVSQRSPLLVPSRKRNAGANNTG